MYIRDLFFIIFPYFLFVFVFCKKKKRYKRVSGSFPIFCKMEEYDDRVIHHCIVPIHGSIGDLMDLPENCGVCINVIIHSTNRVLFLEKSGIELDLFLRAWSKCLETVVFPYRRTLMIRVCCHSIEEPCLKLLEKHGITDYFFEGSRFLDIFEIKTQMPDLAKFAYRFSEYEGLENLNPNPELYDWLFIDSLTGVNIINPTIYNWATKNGIQICVVAPALHDLPYKAEFFQALKQYNQITLLLPLSYKV